MCGFGFGFGFGTRLCRVGCYERACLRRCSRENSDRWFGWVAIATVVATAIGFVWLRMFCSAAAFDLVSIRDVGEGERARTCIRIDGGRGKATDRTVRDRIVWYGSARRLWYGMPEDHGNPCWLRGKILHGFSASHLGTATNTTKKKERRRRLRW